jgi:FdhD protein
MTMSSKSAQGIKYDAGTVETVIDELTVEAPLQVTINGNPFVVTMRTPGDDYRLVIGLLFTEGVAKLSDTPFPYVEQTDLESGVIIGVDLEIPEIFLCDNLHAKRSLMINASCGLCGTRDLDDLNLSGDPLTPAAPLDIRRLPAMAAAMRAQQKIFNRTGGIHAAAAFSAENDCLCVFEDVGRHNAVDKVVGHLLENDGPGSATAIFVSGRVSFEIVSKAYRAGIPYLIAVSAPSSLAVDIARHWGMSIIGFCRGDRATVYAHPENVEMNGPQ